VPKREFKDILLPLSVCGMLIGMLSPAVLSIFI